MTEPLPGAVDQHANAITGKGDQHHVNRQSPDEQVLAGGQMPGIGRKPKDRADTDRQENPEELAEHVVCFELFSEPSGRRLDMAGLVGNAFAN